MVMFVNSPQMGAAFPPFMLTAHTYWRIMAARRAGNSDWSIGEIEIAATAGGADQCTGGTASASSTNGGAAANAFDNNTTTQWGSTFAVNSWVQYQFASPVKMGELRMAPPTGGITGAPDSQGVDVFYSDNGTTFYHYASCASPSPWVAGTFTSWTFTDGLPNLSTTWRNLTFFRTDGSSLSLNIAELEFAAAVGGANMCTGGSGFSNENGSGSVTNAFDNNTATTTRWTNTLRAYVGYTFPSAVSVKEMRVTGDPTGGTGNPQDLKLQLPDGSTVWRTAAQASGYAAWSNSEIKSVVVP